MGLPADMPAVIDAAKRYDLKVIEDSCETAFANAGGAPVGSWGDVGCFSTYMAHYIVTGVGGLCTTSDSELAVDLRSLMNHGRDSIYLSIDDDNGKTWAEMQEIIARRFNFVSVGHSFRCTEMEAALGCAQMERRHETVAARYTAGLQVLSDVLQLPTAPAGFEHVHMLYPLVTKHKSKYDLVVFLESHGIETRDLLHLLGQPVYRKMFGDLLPKYPVAEHLHHHGFYIGCHQYITDDEVEYVLDLIHSYFGRARL
jgi:perosamine synthetase